MKRPKFEAADAAWAGIAVGVLAYDYLCPPGKTLSERMDTYLEHPHGKYAAYAAIGVTALHLANVYDRLGIKWADPFHQATKMKGIATPKDSTMREKLPTPIPTKLNRDYWANEASTSEDGEHRSFAARLVTRIAVQNAVKIGRMNPPVFRDPEGQDGA
ncbi:DUF7427 family protein [Rhodococcus qingshengii]|uniref:DUF7427 family protein n=1 Tax=Rhodococcus qingshengii TaxID=334542 RepID=UPI00294328EE|nr:hypothetical protein [Rhodococcus qingshengii]WOI85954.1 hypothetical protein R0122_22505 [Rhodococcus qingshengii]